MTTDTTTRRRAARPKYNLTRHDELRDRRHVGPIDDAAVDEILALLPTLPTWPKAVNGERGKRLRGTAVILRWLQTHTGNGWQDRWISSGADTNADWIDMLAVDHQRGLRPVRDEIVAGLAYLLLCRVVLPSYQFFDSYKPNQLYTLVRKVLRPDLFDRMEQLAAEREMPARAIRTGVTALTKIMLHTGRDIDQLTPEDLLEYRAKHPRPNNSAPLGLYPAWEMLGALGAIPDEPLRQVLRRGQRPTAELVDRYQLRCRPVRDLLVRYLDERRPALDYASLISLINNLVGLFWADIERHHPDVASLHLPAEVAEGWKQRITVVTRPDGTTRPRKQRFAVLLAVRAFYLDIAEMALQDASWAKWSAPSPVGKNDAAGVNKARKCTEADIHQRIRERLPHLPVLVDAAERHLAMMRGLLTAATRTDDGGTFIHEDGGYRRVPAATGTRYPDVSPHVRVENLHTGEQLELVRGEDDAFWAWAIIEVLRHTGVRVEELLELTQLAITSYTLPDTGEMIPLLQIVPSKSNEERLLLVSPELASVLASIVSRLRSQHGGTIPLVARYDHHECVTGPALPHLFQRARVLREPVIGPHIVTKLLNATLARTGLRTATGQPLHYTAHDFRRIFATDAVTGGLPVHIVARLLGHAHIATTQRYTAVFQDDLIRSYRTFLDARRAVRPEGEYREPTDEEIREFHAHFEIRKLELGTCGRPYGTPCKHEHACVRCSMLRVDPNQRGRLIEIIRNLNDRIAEARNNGWLGEVNGLRTSLNAAEQKLLNLDRTISRNGATNLGLPATRRAP